MKMSPLDRLIMQKLSWLCRKYCGTCMPKHATLALWCGVTRETICRRLKALRAAGLLDWKGRGLPWKNGGLRKVSNLYKVGRHWCDRMSQQKSANIKKKEKERWNIENVYSEKLQSALSEPFTVSAALLRWAKKKC